MVSRQIVEALFRWTGFRNLEKEEFYAGLWIVGIFDCYFGGAVLFVAHTTYFLSYKCGAYLALICLFDGFWLYGFFTKYVYIILFMCNTWWCKKYALTGRCRGCWIHNKGINNRMPVIILT